MAGNQYSNSSIIDNRIWNYSGDYQKKKIYYLKDINYVFKK